MGEAGAGAADGDGSTEGTATTTATATATTASDGPRVIEVADDGDLVLDVVFETSPEVLKAARRAAHIAARKSGSRDPARDAANASARFKPKVRIAYRVSLDVLKKQSHYFSNLLTNVQFHEAKIVTAALARLALRNLTPAAAGTYDLPWVTITDDDEATGAAGREVAFEEMLRILHQQPLQTEPLSMGQVTTMVIIADRFDCLAPVSLRLKSGSSFKWPATAVPSHRDEPTRLLAKEQTLRQKVLVAWLIGQPLRLHQCTRSLIMRGSQLWKTLQDAELESTAAWWQLPDGLEDELRHRRECILATIASVQRHFLDLYSSRERQCKLGYDSSAACDAFQLGQMLRFFVSKKLLFLVDFSPSSLDAIQDTCSIDIDEILTTLKQCPNYQIDKNHTNCGLRIRIDPILDYIRAMLSTNVVSIAHATWKKSRADVSWVVASQKGHEGKDGGGGDEGRRFAFTRALAIDQRLRYEGAIYADRMAKALFTADSWDWTPEA